MSITSIQTAANQTPTVTDPQPIPLDSSGRPPAIDVSLLPPTPAAMVRAVVGATETPSELPFSMVFATLSIATQGKWRVCIDGDHYEALTLWTMASLPPASRKSSVLRAVTAPLHAWESAQAEVQRDDIESAKSERTMILNRIEKIERGAAKLNTAVERKESLQEIKALRDDLPHQQEYPLLCIQDITPEHLGTMLAQHNERLGLISDEGGLFETLAGRYSSGIPNLDLFLQSHDGCPVRVHRGSREPVILHSPLLTIGLAPQPSVIQGLMHRSGFAGRGLMERFLVWLPPSNIGTRTLQTEPIPEGVNREWEVLIHSLLNHPQQTDSRGGLEPYTLNLSPAALTEWKGFALDLEQGMAEGGGFEGMRGWMGKLAGRVGRIAGIMHCAAHSVPQDHPISESTMKDAVSIGFNLIEHAKEAHDLMGADSVIASGKRIWRWITEGRHEKFTKRDCHAALRGTFRRVADLNPSLDLLIERHLIIDITERTNGAGRPSQTYRINGYVLNGW